MKNPKKIEEEYKKEDDSITNVSGRSFVKAENGTAYDNSVNSDIYDEGNNSVNNNNNRSTSFRKKK